MESNLIIPEWTGHTRVTTSWAGLRKMGLCRPLVFEKKNNKMNQELPAVLLTTDKSFWHVSCC